MQTISGILSYYLRLSVAVVQGAHSTGVSAYTLVAHISMKDNELHCMHHLPERSLFGALITCSHRAFVSAFSCFVGLND